MYQGSLKIDLDRLKKLLNNCNIVFQDKKTMSVLIGTIMQTCAELLKSYCIHAITNKVEPDCQYIKEIQEILNRNLFSELCHDSEMLNIMQTYVQSYDGSTTALS